MYEEAKNLLTSQGKFYINLGLERISKVLALLGNPQDKLNCIHVAGTNGKGSVCAILNSVLLETGKNIGLYTSPHLYEYTERIKLNDEDISEDDFAKYVFDIVNLADKNGIHLTEFEILTALAFKYFADNNADIVVLETGLGGRFDATNVIKKNLCSIITHIDLDHTERLGETKDKIAFEKAGIIKPDCPVITSEGYEAIKDAADENNSLFVMVAPFENTQHLALKGTYQQENLSLALAAIRLLFPKMLPWQIEEGLKKAKHPGRFQYVEQKKLIIDGAHNPNGIKALKESLDFYFPNDRRRFIFGCLKNKDYKKMISELFEQGDEVSFYQFNNPNSCSVQELQKVCNLQASEFDGKLSQDRLNIICGSLYMISELADILDIKR